MLNKDKIFNALTDEFVIVKKISNKLGLNPNSVRISLYELFEENLIESKKLKVSYVCGSNKKTVMSLAFRRKQK